MRYIRSNFDVFCNAHFSCRSQAVYLTAKHNGNASAARDEMAQMYPGLDLPSQRFFKRNAAKFLKNNTVEDLVITLIKVQWDMKLCLE